MIQVAIIGGGPAGSYCAYCLAENGIYPTMFDHSHPREKPCGGIISPMAQELFPFLKNLPIEHVKRKRIYFIQSSRRKMAIDIKRGEIICLSRLEFDQFLLNMSLNKGAQLIPERVIDVSRCGNFWKIKTSKSLYFAEKLVGADGVNSLVREKVAKPLASTDKGICYGYFAEGLEKEEICIHFLPHRKGYIWIIPRKRVSSIGIGCTEIAFSSGIKKEFDVFIAKQYPNIKITARWAALIPNIKNTKTLYSSIAGKTWILIGDAAGHVDPVSGEGIPYALLSGELAAQAIAENNMPLFENLWRQAYGSRLLLSIKIRNWIYKKPILEWYVRYLKIRNHLPK